MHDRLIIFCRYPVPGKTKTRLISTLGAFSAADLHRRLTEETFARAKEFVNEYSLDLEVSFEGGSSVQMRRWLGPIPVLSGQEPGDLGHRMQSAFTEAFRQGCKKVVLVGTDVPDASKEHLLEAFSALDNNEIVLGPANDGGYWLIGLTHPVDIFSGIPWGGNTVLDSTFTLAKRIGLRSAFLGPLNDIDTIDDVNRWRPEEGRAHCYLSIVIPALNEEINIGRTILNARNENAEIIVVDGGSRDATIQCAIDSGAKVISGPKSRALQQNLGAEASKGKTLLFLHADTLLPEGYMNLIFEALMDRKVAAGAFRFATDLDTYMMKIIELMVNLRSRYLGMPYGDQGTFLRKSVFEAAGGFPDEPIAEDLFLVRHLSSMGRICIVPASVITSGRRWKRLGIIRTTLINTVIVAGCLAGVKPEKLASLYSRRS